MSEKTFDQINDATGFANGDLFETFEQVYDYFTVESLECMFGTCPFTDEELDDMAEIVIENKWHFKKKK